LKATTEANPKCPYCGSPCVRAEWAIYEGSKVRYRFRCEDCGREFSRTLETG